MSKSKRSEFQVEFFLSKTGIEHEVLERDIAIYLGDVVIQKAALDGRKGYLIKASRPLTNEEHARLKKDSARWQAARESHRSSEASSTGDSDGIIREFNIGRFGRGDDRPPDRARRVYYEPQSSTNEHGSSGAPTGFGSKDYDRDIALERDQERKTSYSKVDHVPSHKALSVADHTSTASVRSADGVRPYHDASYDHPQLPKRYHDERRQEAVNEIVLPALGSLKIEDHRSRRGKDDLERQKTPSGEPRRRSYHAGIREEGQKRYDFQDQGFDLIIDRTNDRLRESARNNDSKPRLQSYYSDRPAKVPKRKVMIDDLDSVTGANHVIRDPKDPLSTRSRGLKESERSRRIREIGRREVAEEQAIFRRQRSIEHLDLVKEDEEESQLDKQSNTRSSRQPRRYYDYD